MATVTKAILTDETGLKIVDAINSKGIMDIINNYGLSHNSIYRGKDLTSYFASGEMSQAIANGTFKDIYIGDYIIKPITVDGTTYNVKWVVADFDYYYGVGDTECATHHILMIPDVTVQLNVSMNDTNDTTGAYLGSKMWTVNMPLYKTGIINAFGDAHVLKHRELLTKTMIPTAASAAGAGWTGSCTDWAWTDTWVNIPNEPMVYGGRVFSSSGYDVGCANKQLALFRHERFSKNKYSDGARKWFWLRAVASGSRFCFASHRGYAAYDDASHRDSYGGIRPYFLLR